MTNQRASKRRRHDRGSGNALTTELEFRTEQALGSVTEFDRIMVPIYKTRSIIDNSFPSGRIFAIQNELGNVWLVEETSTVVGYKKFSYRKRRRSSGESEVGLMELLNRREVPSSARAVVSVDGIPVAERSSNQSECDRLARISDLSPQPLSTTLITGSTACRSSPGRALGPGQSITSNNQDVDTPRYPLKSKPKKESHISTQIASTNVVGDHVKGDQSKRTLVATTTVRGTITVPTRSRLGNINVDAPAESHERNWVSSSVKGNRVGRSAETNELIEQKDKLKGVTHVTQDGEDKDQQIDAEINGEDVVTDEEKSVKSLSPLPPLSPYEKKVMEPEVGAILKEWVKRKEGEMTGRVISPSQKQIESQKEKCSVEQLVQTRKARLLSEDPEHSKNQKQFELIDPMDRLETDHNTNELFDNEEEIEEINPILVQYTGEKIHGFPVRRFSKKMTAKFESLAVYVEDFLLTLSPDPEDVPEPSSPMIREWILGLYLITPIQFEIMSFALHLICSLSAVRVFDHSIIGGHLFTITTAIGVAFRSEMLRHFAYQRTSFYDYVEKVLDITRSELFCREEALVRILGGRLKAPGQDTMLLACRILSDWEENRYKFAKWAKRVNEKKARQEDREMALRRESRAIYETRRKQRLGRDRVDMKKYWREHGFPHYDPFGTSKKDKKI